MTGSVIREAREGARTIEEKDVKTGGMSTHPAYPWTHYLLLPVTIPADIATSPLQGLMILIMWGTC